MISFAICLAVLGQSSTASSAFYYVKSASARGPRVCFLDSGKTVPLTISGGLRSGGDGRTYLLNSQGLSELRRGESKLVLPAKRLKPNVFSGLIDWDVSRDGMLLAVRNVESGAVTIINLRTNVIERSFELAAVPGLKGSDHSAEAYYSAVRWTRDRKRLLVSLPDRQIHDNNTGQRLPKTFSVLADGSNGVFVGMGCPVGQLSDGSIVLRKYVEPLKSSIVLMKGGKVLLTLGQALAVDAATTRIAWIDPRFTGSDQHRYKVMTWNRATGVRTVGVVTDPDPDSYQGDMFALVRG